MINNYSSAHYVICDDKTHCFSSIPLVPFISSSQRKKRTKEKRHLKRNALTKTQEQSQNFESGSCHLLVCRGNSALKKEGF
jgi:hypothetical protein